jgi:hypothetical protein
LGQTTLENVKHFMFKISNATERTDQEKDVEGHNYAETIERTVTEGADNGTQGVPLSAYYCITLQVLPT